MCLRTGVSGLTLDLSIVQQTLVALKATEVPSVPNRKLREERARRQNLHSQWGRKRLHLKQNPRETWWSPRLRGL